MNEHILTVDILLAQYKALRDEILWINSAKLLIVQAKYLWIAGVLGGFSFFVKRNNILSIGKTLFILNLFLCSLIAYDLIFAWLDTQVLLIGKYIKYFFEDKAFKGFVHIDGFVFWENYFSCIKANHSRYLFIGLNVASLFPLASTWGYLYWQVSKLDDFSVRQKLSNLGLLNIIFFLVINIFYFVVIYGHAS